MEIQILSPLSVVILIWLVSCCGLWIWGAQRVAFGGEMLPSEPREPYPCGLSEVLLVVGVYFLMGAGLQPWILPAKPAAASPDAAAKAARLVPLIVLNSAATITAVTMVLTWTALQGVSLRRMGLIPKPSDVVVGITATIMLLPPVLMLQGVLGTLIEYHHPLLEVLQKPQPLATILAMGISSIVVAPLTEEFFFRGLLQGWLSRLAGAASASPVEAPVAAPAPPRRPWWPAVVSSLLFAAVHLGQGAAPITLFFLSLGLGYLYRQTGRIWAGVVVHMALNGLTTVATILATTAP